MVLPALAQVAVAGVYNSELGISCVLTTMTLPSGSRPKPSSEKVSDFPVALTAVQVRLEGLNKTCFLLAIPPWPIIKTPSGCTRAGESPILAQPAGGLTAVQMLVSGS